MPNSLSLSELRPGAPGRSDVCILFTVEPSVPRTEPSGPGTEPSGTAVLLAAGTGRDWLEAWYTQAIDHCRTRYERERGGTS